MSIQLTIFFIIIYMLLSLTIIVQSSLIIVVLGKEWVQVKRLSPIDMIITSLGISQFLRQWASILHNFYYYFDSSYVFGYLGVIWDFANTATFWFTGLLAVFYCVKVSTFTHPTFLWLKWRISRLVPWLLLSCLLFSCVAVIPSICKNFTWPQVAMENSPRNSTVTDPLKKFAKYFNVLQRLVNLAIPFLVFLAPIVLLITSLYHHLKHIQNHNTSHRNSGRKPHTTALKSLAIFLILFTSYFLTLFVSSLGYLFEKRSWFWAWEVVVYTVTCVHSTSLMLSSPTWRKFLKKRC